MRVVLGARREEHLQKLVAEIRAAGGEAVYAATDVARRENAENLAKKDADTYGRIDVWVNNAGLMPLSELSKGKIHPGECIVEKHICGASTINHDAFYRMLRDHHLDDHDIIIYIFPPISPFPQKMEYIFRLIFIIIFLHFS